MLVVARQSNYKVWSFPNQLHVAVQGKKQGSFDVDNKPTYIIPACKRSIDDEERCCEKTLSRW